MLVEEGSVDAAFVIAQSGTYVAHELRPGAALDTVRIAHLVERADEGDWIPELMRAGENTFLDAEIDEGVHARLLAKNEVLVVVFPGTTRAEHVRSLVTELLRPPSPHGPIRPPRPPSA